MRAGWTRGVAGWAWSGPELTDLGSGQIQS